MRLDTGGVPSCCDPKDYNSTFSDRFARRVAKRYSKHGLSPAAVQIVEFVTSHGVKGASVLEIGGGVGDIQLELLRRGAAKVTNLEISTQYEAEAARLLERSGMARRVDRRFLDIARLPDGVEPAGVVVLHRVVCCYADYQSLLSAAARHARRLFVYSHPPDNPTVRAMFWGENCLRRIRRNAFRAYVHPPDAMIAAAEAEGLRTTYRHHSWD
ncbi:MAG: class I SAM-dependent methyltransferase, partial [Actinomycetes bacterium]